MSGPRIRLARLSNGLSLQDLANILCDTGLPITKAALSKYENEINEPSEYALERLAQILDMDLEFFHNNNLPDFQLSYSRSWETGNKMDARIDAFLQISFEQFFQIERLLGQEPKGQAFTPLKVTGDDKDAIDELSVQLRRQWNAPEQPLSSVIGLLEDNGIFVFPIPASFSLPYVAGVELRSNVPFIGYSPVQDTVDILRVRILEALGSIIIRAEDETLQDHLNRTFARAFLLPRKRLLQDLGADYRNPTYWELTLLKKKYGISKIDIRKRLRDLKLLQEAPEPVAGDIQTFKSLRRQLDSSKDTLMFSESPVRFHLDVLLAYKYGLISKARAATMLPKQYIQMTSWDN